MRNPKWLMFSIARTVGIALKSVLMGAFHFAIALRKSELKK
jgi:hypothetical protein